MHVSVADMIRKLMDAHLKGKRKNNNNMDTAKETDTPRGPKTV